jgi:hypothetical protein
VKFEIPLISSFIPVNGLSAVVTYVPALEHPASSTITNVVRVIKSRISNLQTLDLRVFLKHEIYLLIPAGLFCECLESRLELMTMIAKMTLLFKGS